ncbi:hypothetical protein AAH080_22970 [Bacteroides thetaiotaomicron]|uniref:hypothetical protein n=1 Tax=Bacteroides thetaiotaomicron TaxID=818 RepID=UPI0039B66662
MKTVKNYQGKAIYQSAGKAAEYGEWACNFLLFSYFIFKFKLIISTFIKLFISFIPGVLLGMKGAVTESL